MIIPLRLAASTLVLAVTFAGCDDPIDDGRSGRSDRTDGGAGGDGRDGLDAGRTDSPDSGPSPPAPRDSGSGSGDAGTVSPHDAGGGEGGGLTAAELDLLEAINAERATGGLAPVTIDERLLCAARTHALDVGSSGSCGHVGSDGSWPWDRAMACGFPQPDWTVNEIAAGPGFRDGADAVWGWSHSSGHYAALMHERAATVGVAVHETCFIALFDCCVSGSE